MTPIIKRLELAEAALTKNGFVLVDDVWVAQPAAGELPPLPKYYGMIDVYGDERVTSIEGWTADQMRGYAIDYGIQLGRAAQTVDALSHGDDRGSFEAWAKQACDMPDTANLNWDAEWTKAAYEGWQAHSTLTQRPGIAADSGRDAALVKEQVEQYRKGYRHGYEEGKSEIAAHPANGAQAGLSDPNMFWDAADTEGTFANSADAFAEIYAGNCMSKGDVSEVEIQCAVSTGNRMMRIEVTNDEENWLKWEWLPILAAAKKGT